ncbi:uncharacterized protein LOC132294838 [Cornus florida]|uniref:uncharacterized protein LOC132294838 n=1 Tax=Cornus florida TaxID=4283 RepID=UPI002896B9E8|nr:uncharacterized protein LOC132294838 [Cornus florida]
MDTALATTVNVLATPATHRLTNPPNSAPAWLVTGSNMLDLYATNSFLKPQTPPNPIPRKKNTALFLTHCSTRPNTDDRDSATDEDSTVEPNSNPNFEKSATPISNYALSSSNSLFSRGLVFDLGPENAWDCTEIGSPVVKRYLSDEEERWYLWYHGRGNGNSGSDSIGLAVSSNGIHWERGRGHIGSSGDVGLVLNCSKDWWAFDTHSIRPGEVVIMSSSKLRANSAVYWLFYTGFSSEKVESFESLMGFNLKNPERARIDDDENGGNGGIGEVFKSFPGLAMSQDGRHWARIEGEHHTGALLDVGSKGEWDSLFIAGPQVVFHGSGDLRMYYHSFDVENGHFAIGIARSRDGMRWVKLGKIIGGGANGAFDEYGAVNARVVRNRKDGNYVMVYEGVAADGGRSIGVAVSKDGLKNWQRVQDGAVLKPSEEDGWDNREVGSPCLVQMDGDSDEWRLYYRGIGEGGRTGIGMAVSAGREIRSFRRWTGFHL